MPELTSAGLGTLNDQTCSEAAQVSSVLDESASSTDQEEGVVIGIQLSQLLLTVDQQRHAQSYPVSPLQPEIYISYLSINQYEHISLHQESDCHV
jgi:hypothetical protein